MLNLSIIRLHIEHIQYATITIEKLMVNKLIILIDFINYSFNMRWNKLEKIQFKTLEYIWGRAN